MSTNLILESDIHTSGPSAGLAVDTQNLRKRFGQSPSSFQLGPLTLALKPGDTIGILGKNGAGKSTLFQLLTGNLDATKGDIYILGQKMSPDTPQTKKLIGYMPQNLALPKWVTGRALLDYVLHLNPPKQLSNHQIYREHILNYWDLIAFGDMPIAACSQGTQKRLALALATASDPPVLILDEPFEALDLVHLSALLSEIRRRTLTGQTTLLATHIADYAAQLCNRCIIIDQGQPKEFTQWPGVKTTDNPETSHANTSARKKLIEEAFVKLVGAEGAALHQRAKS